MFSFHSKIIRFYVEKCVIIDAKNYTNFKANIFYLLELITNFFQLQGAELIRVSKFYKDSKQGKFVSYIHEDTKTLFDSFRRGAKESSEYTQAYNFC